MQRITVGVDAGKRTHQVAAYDPAAGTVVGQGSFEGITNRGLPPGRVHGAWRSSPAQCAAGPELWSLWVCLATEQ